MYAKRTIPLFPNVERARADRYEKTTRTYVADEKSRRVKNAPRGRERERKRVSEGNSERTKQFAKSKNVARSG